MKLSLGTLALAILVAAGGGIAPAMAHHSGAMFEPVKTVTVSGTVKAFQYTNPHSWLQIVVVGANGGTTLWGFESEGPSTLLRAGIPASAFQPGDKVTVVCRPMRDGRPAGSLVSVTKADGKVYSPRPPPPPPNK